MVKQKKESEKVSKERKQTILFIGVILMIIIITLMITAKPNYTELEQKVKS